MWAEDPALRAALIRTLATSADARAFDVLLDTVEKSEGGEARLQAINGLGLIGDPRALPVLRDLAADADERERRKIRTAIERIIRGDLACKGTQYNRRTQGECPSLGETITGGGPRPLAELMREAVMREAVEAPEPYQRVAALEALGEWGEEEEILPTIVTVALRDEDPFAREVALQMLEARLETLDELVKPVAQVVLTPTSPQDGRAAFDLLLELLGEIDEEGGWGPLPQILRDLDRDVNDLGQEQLEEP